MTTIDPGFCEAVEVPSHIGLFTSGADRAQLLDYVRRGVERSDEAAVVAGPGAALTEFRAQLEALLGRSLAADVRAGSLRLVPGSRDADAFLAHLFGEIRGALAYGAHRVRALGLVAWDVSGWPAPEDQLWLETRVDAALEGLPALLVCAFDITALPGQALTYAGLETHPLVCLDGRLVTNALVLDPAAFISQRLVRLPWLEAPARVPAAALVRGTHACAFFMEREEEYATLLPLVRDGLRGGQVAVHIVDPERRADHVERLTRAGIAVPSLEASPQLIIRDWQDTVLVDGRFDAERQLATLAELLERGERDAQLIVDMAWALGHAPGVEALVEYEARINETMPRAGDTVICTYDSALFAGAIALDILRAHPVVIIAGSPQDNGLYTPPGALLGELRDRRQDRSRTRNPETLASPAQS